MTILNVEPGGTDAVKARFRSPPSGPLAAARMAPSLTRMATSAEPLGWPASAASAAFWTFWSSVVFSGCAVPSGRSRTAPARPRAAALGRSCRPRDHHVHAGRAAQQVVVLLLQPGLAHLVADDVLAGVGVHLLLEHVAHGAQQGPGERRGSGRSCSVASWKTVPGRSRISTADLVVHLPAQRHHVDERVRLGRGDPGRQVGRGPPATPAP